ncbi:MAG TPA: protein kinase [Kofleriaceae bacterium]|jgi:serine/threonine protein kinase
MSRISEVLAEVAAQPAADWPRLLAARFPTDGAAARQALLWLHAERATDEPDGAPSLGPGNERYQLGVRLDGGATASVWLARDRKLDRDVAIKVFHAERAELAEVLAEARAASDVISDHVVRILDVHDSEPAYLVMELVGEHEPRRGLLVPGQSAEKAKPRDTAEAVRWVRDIARGVRDAHLRNVFHRDLKPHNVLITPVSRRAKIADFGLAVSRATPGPSADGLVVSGVFGPARIAGTPEFMAPEQARGLPVGLDPRDADERAILVGVDVWGLGAIAYALLVGDPPWRGRAGTDAWERAASGEDPRPLPGSVPKRLRAIVRKALAACAEDRYVDAGELADELDAYLVAKPTSFDRSPIARARLWSRRNPQLTVAGIVLVGLAGVSVVGYISLAHLRQERAGLFEEIAQADRDKEAASSQAERQRQLLAETEAEATKKTNDLAELRHKLDEAKSEYAALETAQDETLANASAATQKFAQQLGLARADRDTAEQGRKLYEGFWTRARTEADAVGKERDTAQHERDRARAERDQAVEERDSARAALAQADSELDAVRDERDKELERRRQTESELAKLASDLAALKMPRVSTNPATAPPPTPSPAPPKGKAAKTAKADAHAGSGAAHATLAPAPPPLAAGSGAAPAAGSAAPPKWSSTITAPPDAPPPAPPAPPPPLEKASATEPTSADAP